MMLIESDIKKVILTIYRKTQTLNQSIDQKEIRK